MDETETLLYLWHFVDPSESPWLKARKERAEGLNPYDLSQWLWLVADRSAADASEEPALMAWLSLANLIMAWAEDDPEKTRQALVKGLTLTIQTLHDWRQALGHAKGKQYIEKMFMPELEKLAELAKEDK